MPTFYDVEISDYIDGQKVTQYINVDFEVYCNTCGAGLCLESHTRKSHNRSFPQVVVNACPRCMEAKDYEIDQLRAEVRYLEARINELESIK